MLLDIAWQRALVRCVVWCSTALVVVDSFLVVVTKFRF